MPSTRNPCRAATAPARQLLQASATPWQLHVLMGEDAAAIVELAEYTLPVAYAPVACDSSTSLGLGTGDFATPRTVTFISPTRGNADIKQNVDCNTGSAQCALN